MALCSNVRESILGDVKSVNCLVSRPCLFVTRPQTNYARSASDLSCRHEPPVALLASKVCIVDMVYYNLQVYFENNPGGFLRLSVGLH